MMYKDKFVVVVKSQEGKILRESGDVVHIPFGDEYSLQFKNLNSRRAVISVEIDGQDVLDGHQLIINANQNLNLERFIDSLDSGNKFKFIQKTKEIQEFRGDKIDDGFIRVTFQYEKPAENPVWLGVTKRSYDYTGTGNPHWYNSSNSVFNTTVETQSLSKGLTRGVSDSSTSHAVMDGFGFDSIDSFVPLEDEGITVKGSKSNQSFRKGSVGQLETEKHVLILRLKGFTNAGNEVKEPLTVNTKLQCSSCGKIHDSNNQFCGRCGTALL
ncbi:hypothetical protein D3C81_610090 [compost metagenome]